MAGTFVTLEGGEGVGKSTQARMLADALQTRGIDVLLTREPGGTPGAEAIRSLLLDTGQDWSPEAESLLFAAARSDHVAKAIRPTLKAGAWVVCDRFLDSSRAYQGGEGGMPDERILDLHNIGAQGLLPDLTILLTADEERVLRRLAVRDGAESDRIGGRSLAYHRAVSERFHALAAAEPERFVAIAANGSPEEIHGRIMQALSPLLGEHE